MRPQHPGATVRFAAADPASDLPRPLRLRKHLGRELGLIDGTRGGSSGSTDFPMFDWDEDGRRWTAVHHPFTRAARSTRSSRHRPGRARWPRLRPRREREELGGGSIRIHEPELQAQVFECSDLPEQQRTKFGFLLDALADGRAAARRDRVRDRPDA